MSRHLFMTLVIFLSAFRVFAQTNSGNVKGLVRDSTHNIVMQSATVSIYKVETGELLSYQLSNNFGRVDFKKLPVGVPLRAIASSVGYAPAKKEFIILPETGETDLHTLNMFRQPLALKEITVSAVPAPVQLRGDTLEFNADAFKLDSNAVVEDMLKKLPGVTIWNDGLITVNGKKINKVLVDGKAFFDTKGKIAIQNLSKNAVEKIQVYEDKSNPDPIDRKTDLNIVLKNDRKDGYFGKMSAGAGTTERYDGNGMISYFSPKDQVSVVAAINNVNKTADNANTLIEINSYKGQGITDDYYSDFAKPGAQEFKSAGFTALHDFATKKDNNVDTNNLKIAYFMTANNAAVNQYLNTDILIGADGHVIQTATTNTSSTYNEHAFHADYEKSLHHSKLNATYDFQHRSSGGFSLLNNSSIGNNAVDKSENRDQQDYRTTSNGQMGRIDFVSRRYTDFASHKNKSLNMQLSYWFNVDHSNEARNRISSFSATDTTQNKDFNRRYLTKGTIYGHNFSGIWGITQKAIPGLRIELKNLLAYYQINEKNAVGDLLKATNQYIPNNRLNNDLDTRTLDYKPGLSFSKSITNRLSNRYRKTWKFDFFAQGQLYDFKTRAQQQIQNLDRSWRYFIPSAGIQYSNNQLGKFQETYSLQYNTSVTYPTLQQLAPIVDDANVSFLAYGNIHLKPSYAHDLSFTYDYNNADAKNPFQAQLNASIGLTDNFITDSSYYDALGRSIFYPINVSGERHAGLEASLKKEFKFYTHQFQLSGKPRFSYSQNPSGLNGSLYQTKRYTWSVNADLSYAYKTLTAQIGETFSSERNVRTTISEYSYHNWKTTANIQLSIPKGLFVNSRIDFNKSIASNTNNIYYTIWNSDLGYRFLKGKNAEIKMSGLDLLHQNKNVVNTISNNSISRGTVNVLQQYFMITLAYYPRKFGLHKKDK